MSAPFTEREQKISAEALARLFHERYVRIGAERTVARGGIDNQQTWEQMPQDIRDQFVAAFKELQDQFLGYGETGKIQVVGIVSHITHEGVVQFVVGGNPGTGGQLSCEAAKALAYDLLDAVEWAETGATIFKMYGGFESPQKEVEAVSFIAALGEARERRAVERIERLLRAHDNAGAQGRS